MFKQTVLKKPITDFAHMKLGILGGGQLARMMALKAHELGLNVYIYSASELDPAAQVTPHHTKGSIEDEAKLRKFVELCDVVTFESEFLNGSMLSHLSLETGTPIFPHPDKMDELSDRLSQKRLLLESGLPTAAFKGIRNFADLESSFKTLGPKLVLKKRRYGYDGYGTHFVTTKTKRSELASLLKDSGSGFIAEEFIPFKREVAIIIGRDLFDDFFYYPLVETHQVQARCDWVCGPITHKKLKRLLKKLAAFLHKNNYVGVMGVECFDTGKDLIINEIAPRVHNTGHYTQNIAYPDQFTAHIKSVVGQKVPKIYLLKSGFAMTNLLGQSSKNPAWPPHLELPFHWYGKSENRMGRKMGHINSFGKNPKKALSTALKERKKVQL